jgi:hypothetical protein
MRQEKKIKGTMLIDAVKTIKRNTDVPWNDYLSDEARELLEQTVLSSQWYPLRPSLECIWAIYEKLGNKDPESAKQWGVANIQTLFGSVYKNMALENDPEKALQKLLLLAEKSFSRGFSFQVQKRSEKLYTLHINDDDPKSEVIVYLIMGWIDAVLRQAGVESVTTKLLSRHWQGSETTKIEISWR